MNNHELFRAAARFGLALFIILSAVPASGLAPRTFVTTQGSSNGSFPIVARGQAANIYVDANDWPGAIRVARDLQTDIKRVSARDAALTQRPLPGKQLIMVGTHPFGGACHTSNIW
jgi:hypothetical protein